jgi:radical SAM protein with 4Fe4S-binding SPASM domain
MLASLPVLILNPHSRCNCRCKMCDIWKTIQVQEISVVDLKRQLESIVRLQVGWVVLSGGEPLMHSDLWSLIDLLRERQIRITLLSSGLLLGRYAESLAKSVDDVIVSLDGPPEVHNSIRGVPGAFEIAAAGVERIREHNPSFPISARCTVQRSNVRHLRETADAAQRLRLNSISFLAADADSSAFARPDGWPMERKAAINLDSGEIAALESELEGLISRGECGQFVCESPEKLRRIGLHFRAALGEVLPVAPVCNAPWNSAVVEADGTVRPCFFQPPIGHLGSGKPLDQILNGPEAVAFRNSLNVATNPICQKCVCSLNWRGF